MRLTPTDIQSYYRPSKCQLRVYLRHHGIEEALPGPYEQVLERLGQEHENRHLATFPSVADLSGGDLDQRAAETVEHIAKGTPVIYQGVLKGGASIGGVECEVFGRPDFLILQSGQEYAIRDSKMSRRITEEDHPEILLQMDLYGWLYEQTLRRPPARLEVHAGTGDIVQVTYRRGQAAMVALAGVLDLKQATAEPYTPVGWSKCTICGYFDRCWPRAEANKDVALVQRVDQTLAVALRERGTTTYNDLLVNFDESQLADFKRPYGQSMRKVGKAAGSILRNARALASGQEIPIQPPAVSDSPNHVMFDLEGLPPQFDDLEKIYLWGTQVFGEKPGPFLAATAGFGGEGDRMGWDDFLKNAKRILKEYGDIPFVHWHHYERTHLDLYVKRYGDRDGVAARVRENLLDLLPITRDSIALPLPSNSLKVVEEYVGFKRTQDEYGGNWAMAKFIEATEMVDEKQRTEVMAEILKYNQEDLAATWAVLHWLKSKAQ